MKRDQIEWYVFGIAPYTGIAFECSYEYCQYHQQYHLNASINDAFAPPEAFHEVMGHKRFQEWQRKDMLRECLRSSDPQTVAENLLTATQFLDQVINGGKLTPQSKRRATAGGKRKP